MGRTTICSSGWDSPPLATCFLWALLEESKQRKGFVAVFGWLAVSRSADKPGFGPAAELLSFASPKESNQKKGEPRPCRFAVPCATRSVRGGCAHPRPGSLRVACPPLPGGDTSGPAKPVARCPWYGLRFACRRGHLTPLLIPHHGQPQGLPLHPSKTAAEPKLRHSARSRGIHVPLHSNLDAATTRSMTACAGQRCPPSPTPFPVIPHSSSWATTRVAPTPLKDSGRTQTSSFRAQSRNPCSPALQLGCCDYAQHDGVCRAPLPPITHSIRRHSSLLTHHHGQPQGLPLHPSKTAAEPKLRHSARSRGIHVPLHSNIDAATTRSMTACAGQRCPPSPTPFPVIPRSVAESLTHQNSLQEMRRLNLLETRCTCNVSAANKQPARGERSERAVWYSKPPLGRAEQRSSVRIKALALFERSEFASAPNAASSARDRVSGTDVARLFLLTFFGEAKKVSRPPGRDPASHRSEEMPANQTPQNKPFSTNFPQQRQ